MHSNGRLQKRDNSSSTILTPWGLPQIQDILECNVYLYEGEIFNKKKGGGCDITMTTLFHDAVDMIMSYVHSI